MQCQCGVEPYKGDVFCRKCGVELPQVEYFLCECGSDVLFEDSFCHGCGAKFDGIQDLEDVDVKKFESPMNLCNSCGQEM